MVDEEQVAAVGEKDEEEKVGEEKEEEEEEEEEEYEVEKIIRSKKTKGVSYYLVRWKGYGSDDDTWEPEENLVDCKEAFEEFVRQENEKRAKEKEAAKESKKKSVVAGQKRRRINEPKSKTFLSSDDDSDGTVSPVSPPTKKQPDKKPVRIRSIVSTDDDSDDKHFSPPKSPVKKPEKKAPKPEPKPKPEVKKEPKAEPKRVYKFLSDEGDDIGTNKTKKKIPKIVKIPPKTPPKKSEVLENAARFFEKDTTNVELVKMKREKKKKKRDKESESENHVAPVQPNQEARQEVMSTIGHLEDLILPFGVDVRVPQADGVHRVTLPIPLEYEDPSGKMSGLENINWTLAVYYDALDLLIKSNCIQDVETLLLKQKLNINQIYGERTLVSLSVHHGKRRMTDMLLRYNPDVNQLLDKGRIALHLAAELGHTEICVSLIEAGSNINARDAILETSLMRAAENGHRSTVEMLLDYGSNFSLVNTVCKTAEDLAREHQHEFIAQKIHHHGEQIADAFINVHKAGNCLLKEQLLPVHTIFPEFNSTFTLCFTAERLITAKLVISRLSIRKGDIGKLLDQSAIKCQWMNQILSLEYPGSVVFQPRLGLNTLVLNFKDYIKKYGIEPLLVSAFEVLVTNRKPNK